MVGVKPRTREELVETKATGPLDGIRVLDLTKYVPGPFATKVLRDFGARVTQLEPPGGDPLRAIYGGMYEWLSAGKSTMEVDLATGSGHDRFVELVRTSDVVVESFTPGVAMRLGVDYEACRAIRPDVVYCSISGSGQTGEYASAPGHDMNFLARAGVLDQIRGNDGEIAVIGPVLADMTGSLFAASAILAALVERGQTGQGTYVDVSLAAAAANLCGPQLAKLAGGQLPTAEWDLNLGADPAYRVYAARDGDVAFAGMEEKFWVRLCQGLGRPDLIDQRRTDPRGTIDALSRIFATRDRADWVARIGEDVCFSPVNTLEEVAQDAHLRTGGYLVAGSAEGTVLPASPVRFLA